MQGWGPQRHNNGENTSRAICMLPILTGMIGKPGTNTGMREAEPGGILGSMPKGENPVKTAINCYQWLNAADHGEQMTAAKDGVRGADKLSTGIKFLWNYGGNCISISMKIPSLRAKDRTACWLSSVFSPQPPPR